VPPTITVLPRSVRKVCQLTGERDREKERQSDKRTKVEPAFNQTETRFGFFGTDLGSSFEHGGRLWFLFGDTWPGPSPSDDSDIVGWTVDTYPEPGIHVDFVSDGPKYRPIRLRDRNGGALKTGGLEVPIAGFSANDQIYIFHSTDRIEEDAGGDGGLDVFWLGRDGCVGSACANPAVEAGVWHALFPLAPSGAARPSSPMAAVTRLDGVLDVFWIGPDGGVGTTWANPTIDGGNWHQPFPIAPPGAARLDSPLVAVTRPDAALDVFWIGPDGGVGTTWANPTIDAGNWHQPFPIAPPGAASLNSPLTALTRTSRWRGTLMGRTVLTAARNNDPTDLISLYDVSRLDHGGKFINISCAVVAARKELPFDSAALLAWGSGRYRHSDVFLACIPVRDVRTPSAWRYCTGIEERSGGPLWSSHQPSAAPLFLHNQVGELSVSFIEPLGLWLMLYNAHRPRGINGRVALSPWGPWSDPVIVFDPVLGYKHFMHEKDFDDGVSDPGREHEWGGEYGPYIIDRYTRAVEDIKTDARQAQIYFLLSTWNPYNIMLMTATIRRAADS
jgi:hypothetical protein